MTIENNNNDDTTKDKDSSQRTTISLKKMTIPLNNKRNMQGSSKTVRVEVKRRKSSGLKVDLASLSGNNDPAINNIDTTPPTDEDTTSGKLTDLEFKARVKALQDALEEEALSEKTKEQTESTQQSLSSNEAIETIETEEAKIEEVSPVQDSDPDPSTNKKPKVKEKPQTEQQTPENTQTPGTTVVFKASEYTVSKPKPALSSRSATSNIENNSLESNVNGSNKANTSRSKKAIEPSEDKKKIKTNKSFAKKSDMGKKISRAVLERVLDNDLEERTRSIASFKRSKQKLKNAESHQETTKVVRDVNIPDFITVSELANRMAVRGAEVVKYLIKIGTMVTLNQTIDGDTAEIICTDFGHNPKRVSESDIENEIEKVVDDPKDLVPRAPIVANMGDVDHGKTTLLDTLRKTSVAAKEAGGITQHVAAYQITASDGRKITFIDTPGHAAFSKIRSRGAVITDIIVLVVAADDGIKDQTIEAISHARSQNVPLVVAINKIDKPHINIDRVKTDLMNHEIILEDFGGEVLSSEISALQNINLDGLIDTILLQAEMMQLKANPNRKAVGTILESRMEKGKGVVASVIIQHGTLKPGDVFVAGGTYGKVRTIFNDLGKKINSAGPSTPIEIVGFSSAPEPGDSIIVMDSEQKTREIAEYRQRVQKDKANSQTTMTIDQLMADQGDNKFELNILIKSDVYGSIEALIASIQAIHHDEININITNSGVGMINESDVDFAKNTRSMIIGFNIGITSAAKNSAKQNGVNIYSNSVIYHIIEEVKKEMSKLLPPIIEENYIGTADVRKIFVISRFGTIAGCYVLDGIIKRHGSKIKVMRSDNCVFEGKIKSMKHEKDEIKESKQSHECGILAEGFNDFHEGDKIECYEIVQKSRFVE